MNGSATVRYKCWGATILIGACAVAIGLAKLSFSVPNLTDKVYRRAVEPFVPEEATLVVLGERDIFACAQAQKEARCPVESFTLTRVPFRFQWQGNWRLPDQTEIYLIYDLEKTCTYTLQSGERCCDYVVEKVGDNLVLRQQSAANVILTLNETTLTDTWQTHLTMPDGAQVLVDQVPARITLEDEIWQVSAIDTQRQCVTLLSPKGRKFELCAQP